MAEKDITGMRHGMCVAVRREGTTPVGTKGRVLATWLIRCDCGTEKTVSKQDFVGGDHRSCGCDRWAAVGRAQREDLAGRRFGKLRVLGRAADHVSVGGFSYVTWDCVCDCGQRLTPLSNHLLRADHPVWSCGCGHQEGLDAFWGPYREMFPNAPRVVRMREQFVEQVDRELVLERDGGLCGLCHTPVDPGDWHLDHIIPIVQGGEHSYRNVQVSHPRCNRAKGGRLSA